jgi:hypothetical protein
MGATMTPHMRRSRRRACRLCAGGAAGPSLRLRALTARRPPRRRAWCCRRRTGAVRTRGCCSPARARRPHRAPGGGASAGTVRSGRQGRARARELWDAAAEGRGPSVPLVPAARNPGAQSAVARRVPGPRRRRRAAVAVPARAVGAAGGRRPACRGAARPARGPRRPAPARRGGAARALAGRMAATGSRRVRASRPPRRAVGGSLRAHAALSSPPQKDALLGAWPARRDAACGWHGAYVDGERPRGPPVPAATRPGLRPRVRASGHTTHPHTRAATPR